MKMAILCFLVSMVSAAAPAARGPHDGQVVEDTGAKNKFEVKIDPNNGKVEVFSLHPKAKPPGAMAITLYHDPETSQTIELRAADPKTAGLPPHFEGELGPNAGSYAGFALKFGVNLKSLKILPYVPYLPTREK